MAKKPQVPTGKKPQPIDLKVGASIRFFRLQRGMSQTELGKRVGVTFQQVQKYEKGTNRIGGSRLKAVADVLGVSVGQLFDSNGSDAVDLTLFQDPQSMRIVRNFGKIENLATRVAIERLVESIAERG